MTTDSSEKRRLMQTRRITCEGFQRDDGLFEIESVLIDFKPYAVVVGDRGRIEAGEPFHQMRLRLVIDTELNIREAAAATSSSRLWSPRGAPRMRRWPTWLARRQPSRP